MDESEFDKSEQATPFKLKRAREKGTVARGIDLGFFASLFALLAYAWVSGLPSSAEISRIAAMSFRNAAMVDGGSQALFSLASNIFSAASGPLLTFAATAFVIALLVEFLQVGPVFSMQPMKPDFKRINPVEGLKRIFSWRMLIEAFKSVVKLAIYGVIAWLFISAMLDEDVHIARDGMSLVSVLGNSAFTLLFYCTVAALFIAALDQLWSRKEFAKKMRMSSREVKREHRDREGDPRLKQKRKDFHKEFMSMAQSLRGARDADIILTNPTHYAVALRYDPKKMEAPQLVSRGSGAFAERIRQIGFVYGVVIHSQPALARALFRLGQVGTEIPDSFYQEVADIYRTYDLTMKKHKDLI